jgi:ssDNA-binding Zn-finger/Zn-ribbon topoisomerase 1
MKKYMDNCGELKRIDVKELSDEQQQNNNVNDNSNTIRKPSIHACNCLKCGSPSNVLTPKNKLSYFLGCSKFPLCKWTQSLPPYISEV